MHPVFVFQQVSLHEAVLTATTRHQAVVAAIVAAVAIAEIAQFLLALAPINRCFLFLDPAGITDVVFIKVNGLLLGFAIVLEFSRA